MGDPQIAEKYQRSSHTVAKVLGPTTDFLTWESSKRLRIPRKSDVKFSRIWLQNFHRTEETDYWRVQTKPCVHQDLREKSNEPTRDWARLACECLGVSSGGVGWQWLVLGSGTLTAGSLASGQITGREHSPTHQQNIGFTDHGLAQQSKIHFPHRKIHSFTSGSFHKPLILNLHKRDIMKTTITEK